MNTSTAIVLAGVWVCAGLMWHSKTTVGWPCLAITLFAFVLTCMKI